MDMALNLAASAEALMMIAPTPQGQAFWARERDLWLEEAIRRSEEMKL